MISANKIQKHLQKEAEYDFVTKPFEMDELLAKVVKYIGTPD